MCVKLMTGWIFWIHESSIFVKLFSSQEVIKKKIIIICDVITNNVYGQIGNTPAGPVGKTLLVYSVEHINRK